MFLCATACLRAGVAFGFGVVTLSLLFQACSFVCPSCKEQRCEELRCEEQRCEGQKREEQRCEEQRCEEQRCEEQRCEEQIEVEREEERKRERERFSSHAVQLPQGEGHARSLLSPWRGRGRHFSFFRGIVFPRGNLGLIWAFPGFSGAFAGIVLVAHCERFGKACLPIGTGMTVSSSMKGCGCLI